MCKDYTKFRSIINLLGPFNKDTTKLEGLNF